MPSILILTMPSILILTILIEGDAVNPNTNNTTENVVQ